MTDTEMLNWLESMEGVNLVSDDYGRWALSDCGSQPVPFDHPIDMDIVSSVPAEDWRPSIREAFLYYASKTAQEALGDDPEGIELRD